MKSYQLQKFEHLAEFKQVSEWIASPICSLLAEGSPYQFQVLLQVIL